VEKPVVETILLSKVRVFLELYDRSRALKREIAERQAAESRLQALNDQLEARVRERTTELRRAKEAAEAASHAKSVFLANMSHEMRTPLNAVLGFAQLLQHDTGLGRRQRENIERILHGGSQLLGLIDDVLDITRIEAGTARLTPRTFDLPALLYKIETAIRPRAEAKGLDLTLEITGTLPHWVAGDDRKLKQVLIHLLDNAVKFTERGGVVLRVELQEDAEAGECLLDLTVRDSGIGIAAEHRERIFQTFSQAPAGEQRGEGTGLGLTLSREFIQLLGGTLQVDSTPGSGSEFRFRIPLRLVPDGEAPALETADVEALNAQSADLQAGLDIAALRRVPEDLRRRIQAAARDLDTDTLHRLNRICARHSPPLADTLDALCAEFRFDLILDALQRADTPNP